MKLIVIISSYFRWYHPHGNCGKKHVWGCSNYSWIISQLCGSISAILTPYWLNCEHVCECVTGSEGELKRGDKLHGYIWVREIKICAVCDHFPCQYNHASQPPFTFYPVIPTSPSLPALTRTSQAGIIELTTLWDRHPPPPPALTLWPPVELRGAGLILSSHPCDLQGSGFVLATRAANPKS